MINWICAQLAKCFNAHLDEREKKIKELVEEARQKADEFNKALDNLARYADRTDVVYSTYRRDEWVSAKHFKIERISCILSNAKVL